MAMPGSGAISFSQLQTEFGGANPISLSEYYNGGAYVSNGAVPSSGAISMNQFYGLAAGWTVTEGGTALNAGFDSGVFGSIAGATSINGAAITAVIQNEGEVKGLPIYTFSVTVAGNRVATWFTSFTITGFGTLNTSEATRSYDAGPNETTWSWLATHVTALDGSGTISGTFV